MKRRAVVIAGCCALAAAPGNAAPGSWKRIHDPLGFSISVPGDWKVLPGSTQTDFTTDDAPAPVLRVFAMAPTGELDPGSTLNSGSVDISVLPLPAGRSQCTARAFFPDMSPDSTLDLDIDTPDTAKASGTDPGGWYTSEAYAWRLSTNPCIGVQYAFSYHADESDQAKSEKPFDRKRLLTLLDSIRATIVLDPKR